MKVSASVRAVFLEQEEKNKRLKSEVDRRIEGIKNPRWHYESRVKELVSFAMKLETGRFPNPSKLEDFFACTIVLANLNELRDAEKLLQDEFHIVARRPGVGNFTSKKSDSFPFDDLRLYCNLKVNPTMPPNDLTAIVFEVQVKTFLQHAWSIATHDMIYKSNDSNWSQERIAYQIKAMLEHAEISIQQSGKLAECTALAKQDKISLRLKKIIKILKSHWGADELPKDTKLLAQNILGLISAIDMKTDELESLLNVQRQSRGGVHPMNISPFSTVIHYLIELGSKPFDDYLKMPDKRLKIVIPSEIEIPVSWVRSEMVNAIFI
ncbi:hypothetical protein [Pseudomonas sp. CDFA 610]|uniref:hypothetical protein n=1 Tax=Pseudomonas sp. CDFA 610 TaxID=2829825 RepID=UPI001E51DBAC|nr:hypothetical protein [Pseudomonas sp. CDFA 610]MCD5985555.1 hypothetical protein [Pseudomonas sp. CDFA 610]